MHSYKFPWFGVVSTLCLECHPCMIGRLHRDANTKITLVCIILLMEFYVERQWGGEKLTLGSYAWSLLGSDLQTLYQSDRGLSLLTAAILLCKTTQGNLGYWDWFSCETCLRCNIDLAEIPLSSTFHLGLFFLSNLQQKMKRTILCTFVLIL